MCMTCGCGKGQTLIGGHALARQREPGREMHYRIHQAAHEDEHQHATNQGNIDFGAGPAGTHAPGMSQSRMVRIERDILAKNNGYADRNRRYFSEHGIFALNLVSSPGSGKTTLLVKTIAALHGTRPLAVIEGDQQTDNDAERIRAAGAPALQINTGKGCHLDAEMIRRALTHLDLAEGGLLLIENVGNLVCPAGFDLGEAAKVVLASVTEGEDKPLKYPDMFAASAVMLVSKADLLPHLDCDVAALIANARRINPAIEVFVLSARTGEGLAAWYGWLRARRAQGGAMAV